MWYFLEKKDESDHVGIFALIFKESSEDLGGLGFSSNSFFFPLHLWSVDNGGALLLASCLIHRKTKRLIGSKVNLLDPCHKN
jgi:hypothetical protein